MLGAGLKLTRVVVEFRRVDRVGLVYARPRQELYVVALKNLFVGELDWGRLHGRGRLHLIAYLFTFERGCQSAIICGWAGVCLRKPADHVDSAAHERLSLLG